MISSVLKDQTSTYGVHHIIPQIHRLIQTKPGPQNKSDFQDTLQNLGIVFL